MLGRLKLGSKWEIENMCVGFWCLTRHETFLLQTFIALRWTLKLSLDYSGHIAYKTEFC
jgi:hypothetical protein